MVILVVGTLGYVGYVVIGNIFGVNGTDALFFQSVVWLLVDFYFQ